MILLAFLIVSLIFLYGVESKELKFLYVFVLFLIIIVHVLSSIQFAIQPGLDYFVSDEKTYAHIGSDLNQAAQKDRWLWILLNEFAKFPLEDTWFGQKFINILMLPLYLYILYKLSGSKNSFVLIFLFFPYLLYMFQVNLRDMSTFVIFMGACYFPHQDKMSIFLRLLILALALFALYFLRPFFIPIVLVSLGLSIVIIGLSNARNLNFKTIAKYTLMASLLIGLLIATNSIEIFNRFSGRAEYLMENGINTLDGNTVNFNMSYAVISTIRFLATPIPTSLFSQVFTYGSSEYGYAHDILRIISQASLFCLAILVIYQIFVSPKRFFSAILSPSRLTLFIGIIITSIIYAIYFGGVSHTRIKIGTYHLIFIPFVLLYSKYLKPFQSEVKK